MTNCIYYYKDSGEKKEQPYKGISLEMPLPNLSENIEIYLIEEIRDIIEDNNKFKLVRQQDKLINSNHEKYSHLKICERHFKAIEKDKFEVIEALKQKLYDHLDMEYPIVERIKDLDELFADEKPTKDRKKELKDKKKKESDLRKFVKNQIENYEENDVFPNFEITNINLKTKNKK